MPGKLYLLLLVLAWGCCCPPPCDCKWKSGKESAICARANFTSIPTTLDTSLQLLDLSYNPIPNIGQDAFSDSGLLNLQKIYLAHCKIRALNRFAFRRLSNLVELDLSHNQLLAVPSHVFESVSELRELKLSGNPIQRLSEGAFVAVPRLVRLELSECRLWQLEPGAFTGLEETLKWLKLDDNRLAEARPPVGLKNLHGLELSGNPWNCTCRLRPFKIWLSDKNIPSAEPASCTDPPRLAGKTWDKLDDSEFACPPGIIPLSPGIGAVEGSNVTLSCAVSGVPAPAVHWLWKNRPVANRSALPSHKKVYVLHYNGTRSSLTVYSTEIMDAGVYFCVATNKAGRAQGNVTLTVTRKSEEPRMTVRALGIGAGVAISFLILSCVLFCLVGGRRQPAQERYEKIEMKSENCLQSTNKVHPAIHEYRGVPSIGEEEDDSSSRHFKTNPSLNSIEASCADLSRVQQHILRKEVLPTTSLYTTAAPDYPDLLSAPPSATLPRRSVPAGGSSQSPLLNNRCESSRFGSGSRFESDSRFGSNSRFGSCDSRYSTESTNTRSGGSRRSTSSLELFDASRGPWHHNHPSLPTSPIHHHQPVSQPSSEETPILNALGSAVYDLHAAQLERFLEEYRSLYEELTRMQESSQHLNDYQPHIYPT